MKKLNIVEITWTDSQHSSGWKYANDMLKEIEGDSLLYKTVGYLFHENKKGVSVVQSFKEDKYADGDYFIDACMTIPRKAILKIKKL
jgi:hypothetical protein